MRTERLPKAICRRSALSEGGIGPFTDGDATHGGDEFCCQLIRPLGGTRYFGMLCFEPPPGHERRVVHAFGALQRRLFSPPFTPGEPFFSNAVVFVAERCRQETRQRS